MRSKNLADFIAEALDECKEIFSAPDVALYLACVRGVEVGISIAKKVKQTTLETKF